MRTALFLSPHLDDVVFSCGGIAAMLHDQGWNTVLATAFTATIMPATGFALACQLDKGLPADVDYMALRRAEDVEAAKILQFTESRHLGLPEAPHRGYCSARELFGAIYDTDDVGTALVEQLSDLERDVAPDLVFAPQGLGNHVDHVHMVRAVLAALRAPVVWFRDTPYAIRKPGEPSPPHIHALETLRHHIEDAIERKVQAACAYQSQISFQFGSADNARKTLVEFARSEARGAGLAECVAVSGRAKELLKTPKPAQASCST